METSLRSISKIFNEKIYRIPDYQRGYAWTNKQVRDYWSDVAQLPDDKNHYVGVITLESVASKTYKTWEEDRWIIDGKSYEPYYVVDGQQRLTTTIILIQAIYEVASEKGIDKLNYTDLSEIRKKYIFESHDKEISRSYLFGYEKDNPSYEFLKIKIFNENSTSGYNKEQTIYTNNLENAKQYFRSKLGELHINEIEKVFKKVTQHLLFNIYSIQSDIDVFIAFETMNNRGLRLSNLELLKNRLIYLTTRFSMTDDEKTDLRKMINHAWRSVYHYLGKNKSNPLADDDFLLTHTNMYFPNRTSRVLRKIQLRRLNHLVGSNMSEELSSVLLENVFSAKGNADKEFGAVTPLMIKEYVESISNAVQVWFELNNPSLAKNFSDDEKIWVDKIVRVGYAFRFFAPVLLDFYIKKPSKKESLQLLEAIERFCFLLSVHGGTVFYRPNEAREALDIIDAARSTKEIVELAQTMLQEYTSTSEYVEPLNIRFERIGFYNWSGIRYFLFEYELSLKEKSKSQTQKIDWEQYAIEKDDYITVEHVYPQSSGHNWSTNYSMHSPTHKRALKDSLGNLLPLSKPKNSSLQNKKFAEKIDNGDGVGYRYGSYSENELTSLSDWTPDEILNRGLRLLAFMEERWKIDLGSEEKKIKLLKLSFLRKAPSNQKTLL